MMSLLQCSGRFTVTRLLAASPPTCQNRRLFPLLTHSSSFSSKKSKSNAFKRSKQSKASDNDDDPSTTLKIMVPKNAVNFSFSRSGGPGGMNVNKVSTRATLRFHVSSASWMPPEIRERLHLQNTSRVGKDGDFTLSSDVHRTQPRNIDDCLQRLQVMVDGACVEPKVRKQYEGIGKQTKRRRKESKRRRSEVKQSRGNNKAWD